MCGTVHTASWRQKESLFDGEIALWLRNNRLGAKISPESTGKKVGKMV